MRKTEPETYGKLSNDELMKLVSEFYKKYGNNKDV